GLADQCDALALVDMQGNAVQYFHKAGIALEGEAQVADEKGGSRHCSTPRISRSASPSRLKPKTAIMFARPGEAVSQQESGRYFAPSATIEPRSGVGGCTPRPRKESEEAIRMTKPRSRVILVRIDGTQFGRISRNMTCSLEAPITSAAST